MRGWWEERAEMLQPGGRSFAAGKIISTAGTWLQAQLVIEFVVGDSTVRQFRPLIQEKRPLKFSYTDATGSMLYRFSPELGASKVCEEAAERGAAHP